MAHKAKHFEHLIGSVHGLSEKQLKNHFELYKGFVKKLSEIEEKLANLKPEAEGNYSFAEISELQRRHAVAFNGALLHELYFSNLTGSTTKPSGDLLDAMNRAFGSMENWVNLTLAGLKTANGWVLLCRSRIDGKLSNNVIEEHHRGVFVEQDIVLAIDGWEHAFMIDYGVKEDAYFRAILSSLDWHVASRRFDASQRGEPLYTAA